MGNKLNNNICLLSDYLKENLSKGDRCVLLSENRPEWLISDIAIMNAGGVTVPLFTTYSEKDYEYIINDCKTKDMYVSNDIQFKKIKNLYLMKQKLYQLKILIKKLKVLKIF